MGLLEYLPHLIYSTALTSISMHHLAAGEDIPEREVERLWRLARSHDVWRAGEGDVKSVYIQPKETVGWKEVLLGRRFDTSRTEELDRKDLERVRLEVEGAGGSESR